MQSYEPKAVTRGLATKIRVKGLNLGGARSVVFDDPSVHAKVLHVNDLGKFNGVFIGSNGTTSTINRGNPAPLHEVTIEVEAGPEARMGLSRFRLLTDAGTTNVSTVSVEPYFGSRSEIEPNNSIPDVLLQDLYIRPPMIIAGRMNKPGDEDYLPFNAIAGDEMVFHISARTDRLEAALAARSLRRAGTAARTTARFSTGASRCSRTKFLPTASTY